MTEYQLDAKGLLCPLPVIKTQNMTRKLLAGDKLTVECTDPGAMQDIPSWCRIFGHEVIQMQQTKESITIVVGIN